MHEEKDHISFVLDLRVPDTYHSSSMIHTLAVIIIDPEKTAFSSFISTLFIDSFIHSLITISNYTIHKT